MFTKIIGWIMIVLGTLLVFLSPISPSLNVYDLIQSVVSIVIGIGLLKRNIIAWYLCVLYLLIHFGFEFMKLFSNGRIILTLMSLIIGVLFLKGFLHDKKYFA